MTVETKAAFARRRGVAPPTVTRWAKEGRIVLAGGQVDVEASIAKLAATAGRAPGVAARHARERAEKAARQGSAGERNGAAVELEASAEGDPPTSDPEANAHGLSYQRARAQREHWASLQAKAEYERQVGALVDREAVGLAMRSVGALVRTELESLPDQLAPVLAAIDDAHEIHRRISDAVALVLGRLGDAVERAKRGLAA